MAHGETTAETNQVVPISGNDVFSAEDAVAAIQTGWVGGTVGLPGPNTNGTVPSYGDQYTIADPKGLVTSSHLLTLESSPGYPFLFDGALVTVATLQFVQLGLTNAISKNAFTFVFTPDATSATLGVWAIE